MKGLAKKSLISLVTAVSLYAYPGAGDPQSNPQTDGNTNITNQSITNNVVADPVRNNFLSYRAKKGFKGMAGYASAQYIYNDKVQIVNIPLGFDFYKGFGVEANIPYVFVDKKLSSNNKNESGIGDISAGVNYKFGGLSGRSGLHYFSVLYKSTTGDEKKTLGSGADAYTLTYKFLKSIDVWTVNFLASYTFNGKYSTQYSDFDYGNSYLITVAGSRPCLLTSYLTTTAKLTYFHMDKTKQTYTGGSSYFDKTDVADLWLQWDSTKFIKNVPVGFGVKIPLLNKLGSTNISKKVSFYLSFAGLF